MKTTATNRKVRELLSALRDKRLIPRPDFQRRLVWSNKDKSSFLETVLLNYPFPEIYVCAGSVDVETGEGTELLVDGQQRMTTLHQYFIASKDLVLLNNIRPYADLSRPEKEAFLQYDVVVRDLGQLELDVVRSVFQRINATKYSLNAMEIHNSRYDGEFKQFGEMLAQRPFFETRRVFGAGDIRRMQDVRFALLVATTVMSTYFNRDDEIEEYLIRFNDEFPMRQDIERELDAAFEFIERMNPPSTSRIWKKADLFSAIIEIHAAIYKAQLAIKPAQVWDRLASFYEQVDSSAARAEPESAAARYYKAALQATNDRSSRITRGQMISNTIQGSILSRGN